MSEQKQEYQYLMPWYINGTLTETEMAQLEKQRQTSPTFQRTVESEIATARLFTDEITQLETVLARQPQAFDQLRQKIAKHQPRRVHPGNWKKLPHKRVPVYALAASVLLSIVGSFWLWQTRMPATAEFEVLTNPPVVNGVVMQLIFAPDVTPEQIQQLFKTQAVQTIGGPSANQVYRVQLQNPADLQYWQQHSQVLWASLELQ